ncbi:hypothetical protein Daesc_001160 [Daldinia eschscholtzii]|uniref:RelA/SpoT domain-containing protein n=1 Tax=Daldinia eschscholtzii TaxID=292717 RepID=A0AAX6N1P4_9PEZI
MDPSYFDYVKHLSRNQPDLKPLFEFLTGYCPRSKVEEVECHVAGLEFRSDETTSYSRIDNRELTSITTRFIAKDASSNTAGLCLLIEDIGPSVMETLGEILDIDPYFFCGHIERRFVDVEKDPPSSLMTSIPSRVGSQNFANLHYQRPIDLGELGSYPNIPHDLRLHGSSTRPRRALPELFGRYVGLIRSCFSIFYKRLDDDRWICLMLMDSISTDVIGHISTKDGEQQASFRTRQVPYRNRRGSISGMPKFSEFRKAPSSSAMRPVSMMDEVARLLQDCAGASKRPPSAYNLFFLSSGPIKLIIDEWLTYSLIMSRYIKVYEYSTQSVQGRLRNFESEDVVDLYRWRRRSQHSLHKLQVLKWFVESSINLSKRCHEHIAPVEEGEDLTRDINYIIAQIEQNGNALEAMIPIMASIIQLLDSRRSVVEAIYVKRLTYIAIVFLPLSFVATLFSMSDNFSIAGTGVWIYVATAVPLLLDQMDKELRPELVNEFKKIYADKKSAFDVHVGKVKEILEDGSKSGAFRAIPITTRTKELNSALGSLARRQAARLERQGLRERMSKKGGNWELYWKHQRKERRINDWGPFENTESMLDALHDFGGVRVCVYFPDDVEEVVSFLKRSESIKIIQINQKTQGDADMDELRKYVEMLEHQSLSPSDQDFRDLEEKPVRSERLFTGYRATHVIAELLGDAVPEWHRESHYKVEIQIATVVMHAWSQIEHDIIYKSGDNEPSDEERGILDLFNGIVMSGEAALKQLAACNARKEKDRSRENSAIATNIYELGAWLATFCDEYSLRPRGATTVPAWNELDKLLDILRSSGEHTSGKLKELLHKVREGLTSNPDAFGDDLPLHLLKAKFDLAIDTTPRFSSEMIQDRKMKTAAEARYLAFRVVHSINMAAYLGYMDEFIETIESSLPSSSELPRPALIDFLELLHPRYPRLNREAEDIIIDFCEAFLNIKNLQCGIEGRKRPLMIKLALMLTDIGYVVSPTYSIIPTQDENLAIVPRALHRILHDPDHTCIMPDILEYADWLTSPSRRSILAAGFKTLLSVQWGDFMMEKSTTFSSASAAQDSPNDGVGIPAFLYDCFFLALLK